MFEAPDSPYLVGFDQPFDIADAPTAPPADAPGKRACKERLAAAVERIAELQPILYAHDRHAVLLIFQALDAAGKDGTIRALLQGVNPAGCVVHNFRVPSDEELDHDFLWRTTLRLPARGMIGVFNRSYYEEVLVVRVHPEFLAAQNLPDDVGQNLPDEVDQKNIWQERYQSMCEHELHLARNGTVIVKFFLHVSRDEQRRRFLARIDEPEKNWKFAERDVREREHWSDYMSAYADTLGATARPWAPWYAVPADDKPFLRMTVAEVVAAALGRLNLHYPRVRESDRERFAEMRTLLVEESD